MIEEEAYTYAQSEWVTRMARLAAAEKHLAKSAERLERARGKLRESEQRRRSTPST